MYYKQKEYELARKMRLERKTIPEISLLLGVSKSSVSRWVKDIPVDFSHSGHTIGTINNALKRRKQREEYQNIGRDQAKRKDPLHMAGCILYWAEGSKERNGIQFVNCDVNMIIFFVSFLRRFYNLKDTDLYIRIEYFENCKPFEEVTKYWLQALGLPESCLRKCRSRVGSKSVKYPYGICRIGVNSTAIAQQIYGSIQEYGNFINEEWIA